MLYKKVALTCPSFVSLMTCTCLWATTAWGTSSLFLTGAEVKQAHTNGNHHPDMSSSCSLKLNAILYDNRNAWTIWINGQPIVGGQSKNRESWSILTVEPHVVHLRVQTKNGPRHKKVTVGQSVTY